MIIRVLCGWLTAQVLPCVLVCLQMHCKKGCAISADLLFLPPLMIFLPSSSPGCGQQNRGELSPISGDDPCWLWCWWLIWWKIKLRDQQSSRHQGPCCPVPCLTLVPLLNAPLKMTNALIYYFPRLETGACAPEALCLPQFISWPQLEQSFVMC